MTFDEYQAQAIATDIMRNAQKDLSLTDPAYVDKLLGLVGEAGEVAEKYKKINRNSNGHISEQDKAEITQELGDVLWHVALLAHYLDTDLQGVAKANIAKIRDRFNRGVIKSSGDNR